MAGFSIDDVRGTFSTDIGRQIAHIDNASNGLLGNPLFVTTLDQGLTELLRVTGDSAHAIIGTSSLVGVESLRSTAELIEQLAVEGKGALDEALAAFAKIKRF